MAPLPELRVISVTDGDTLKVQGSGTNFSVVRLAEIDAPEKCQPYGIASRNSLVEMALNQLVTLDVVNRDRYGRSVAKVTIKGQIVSVNKAQVSRGMAWVYDGYAQDPLLETLEAAARSLRLGLWADPSAIAPWDWRRRDLGCSSDPETVAAPASLAGLPSVVEYRNSVTNHYFMTLFPEEANAIDAGSAGPGWSRTGNTFNAWPSDSTEPGTVAVCRFYAAGPNSHFFTASTQECAGLKELETIRRPQATAIGQPYQEWGYEGIAFRAKLPGNDMNCPSGTEAVHRAYNNRYPQNDQNHRFTTWQDDLTEMAAKGWIYEGLAMCVPK